jgi:hypothetical protein
MGYLAYLEDADNLIKQAQIVVSDPDSSMPAYNAGMLPVTLPARCLNHSDPMKWHLSFPGDTVGVDSIALVCHNLSSDAVITVKGGNSFDPSSSLGTMTWRRRTAFKVFSATETHQFLKIEISDPANIHGFSQIGYIVLGNPTTLSRNFETGWRLADMVLNQKGFSESRTSLPGYISDHQLLRLVFEALTEVEVSEIRARFLNTLRDDKPVFWWPDGSDGTKGFLGRFAKDFERVLNIGPVVSVAVDIEEDAPGPISVPAMPIIR